MSTENDRSQQYWKEPPKETSYEAHLRRKRLKQQQRSRSAKSQIPGTGEDSIDAREFERGRESFYGRAEDYSQDVSETEFPRRAYPRPSTPVNTTPTPAYEDDYEIETELPAELPRQRSRSTGGLGTRAPGVSDRRVTRKTTRHLPATRQRKAWPWVLAGCAGGILTLALIAAIVLVVFFRTTLGGAIFGGIFNQTFTQKNQQTFNISNFSLIQLNNQVGSVASNVTIVVDPTATETTLTTVKKVQAANSSAANNEFAHMPLILSPVNPATPTLILTICSQSNTACGNVGDSVDITITLPPSSNTNASYLFDIETRVGNVSVQQAQLAAGSCLSTGTGNVTFNGSFNTTNSSDLNPCGAPTSNPHPWYKIHSEVGNLDISQLAVTKNMLLDASTTAGSINSDGYSLKIETSNGSAMYYGPLIANAPQPTAQLTLDVGTGNITLHRI